MRSKTWETGQVWDTSLVSNLIPESQTVYGFPSVAQVLLFILSIGMCKNHQVTLPLSFFII